MGKGSAGGQLSRSSSMGLEENALVRDFNLYVCEVLQQL